jgi:thioredoxin-related protein
MIVKTLTTEKELFEALKQPCTKFILVFSPTCGVCDYAEKTIAQSTYTLNLMVDKAYKCESAKCPEFCEKHKVDTVPGLFLFDEHGEEVSSMLFAPDQDQFLFWLTNNMLDED